MVTETPNSTTGIWYEGGTGTVAREKDIPVYKGGERTGN